MAMHHRSTRARGVNGAVGNLFGARGTCGLRSCVAPDPVTAQVMKTSLFMLSGIVSLP